jgi:hypothetical protein
MTIAIIGAGIAGLTCASELARYGHAVTVFDKSRGAGGRMSTRRIATDAGEASFDHGAQYFTVRDEQFAAAVAEWEREGLVARWPHAGEDAWVGVPAMNALVKTMTDGLDMHYQALVSGLEQTGRGWLVNTATEDFGLFDKVIVAIPPEQAAPLLSLHDFEMAREALRARSQPCWTGMFAFDPPLDALPQPIRDHGDISWAVCNRTKPGRSGPQTWVVQARPMWSKANLERDKADVEDDLLAMLGEALGQDLPAPLTATAHRWRFAMSSATGDEAMWNEALGLGACGDWLLGPRVECAWLSGKTLAGCIVSEESAAQPRRAAI